MSVQNCGYCVVPMLRDARDARDVTQRSAPSVVVATNLRDIVPSLCLLRLSLACAMLRSLAMRLCVMQMAVFLEVADASDNTGARSALPVNASA